MLFVHASFKSLGPVERGAHTVIQALQCCIGLEGTLLMPSFNLVEGDRRAATWELATTPSTTGWLTEYFRRLPETIRSDHYSHSVAIQGPGAEALAAGHLLNLGMESPWDRQPWGKTYGLHSPMYRAYESDGKLLMIGVDYSSSTYMHLVEVLYWHELRVTDPGASYPALRRPEMGAFWEQAGTLQIGPIGDARCRLFSIRTYVDTLLAEVIRNPTHYLTTTH